MPNPRTTYTYSPDVGLISVTHADGTVTPVAATAESIRSWRQGLSHFGAVTTVTYGGLVRRTAQDRPLPDAKKPMKG